MNKEISICPVKEYFAASNSYYGFKNYFNEVFTPANFDRIYILKGGPGSGKSTFMKKIRDEFADKCGETEAIYCSSDQNSLDGVILKKETKTVAIVDGTSPHAQDPVFPSACETIINLGEFWDNEKIAKSRSEILEYGTEKSGAYEQAYNYLAICEKIEENADKLISSAYIESKSRYAAKDITANLKNDDGITKVRLITSYGKDGFGKLDTLKRISSTKFHAVGIYGSQYKFMDTLKKALDCYGISYTIFPNPLNPNKYDAIFIEQTKTSIIAAIALKNDENIIDTSTFFDQEKIKKQKLRLEFLWQQREVMLWSAADEFKRASEYHFKLESIYSDAMDFPGIDTIIKRTVQDIKTIFNIGKE